MAKVGLAKVGFDQGGGLKGWRPEGLGAQDSVGTRRVGPEGWGPEGWGARRVGPKGGGAQNFALFFPSLPPTFSFIFSLSGDLLVEFWWCVGRSGPQNDACFRLQAVCDGGFHKAWPE